MLFIEPTDTKLLGLATELATRFAHSAADHDRQGSFPHEHYTALHEAGYLRLVLPAAYNGANADLLTLVQAQERLAHGDAGTALAVAMHLQLLGKVREDQSWPAAVFATVCQELATHGGLVNSIVTEPELGSISRGGTPATSAVPVDGGYVINGHKTFATGAPVLRFLQVMVTLPAEVAPPHGAVAHALVRADAPGLRLAETWGDVLGMRTSGSHDFYFEDVFVPQNWLFGQRALGEPPPPAPPNAWPMAVAAVYLGIGQAACDAAADYANGRVPPSLGKPIAELPHIQQQLGQITIELAAARSVLHHACRVWDTEPAQRATLGPALAAAKYLATNSACHATETALRVAGGFSLQRTLPLERHFRDVRAGLFNPPQDDIALGSVGRAALAARRQARDQPSE